MSWSALGAWGALERLRTVLERLGADRSYIGASGKR